MTKFKLFLLSTIITIVSCDVDDFVPIGQITQKNVVKDEESANKLLNAIYNGLRPTGDRSGRLTVSLCAAGIEQAYDNGGVIGDFTGNEVKADSDVLFKFYETSYKTLNLANIFIEKVANGDAKVSEEVKNKMLSEAKTARAFMHFTLLRVFGQFYDSSSKLGIIASDKFISGNKLIKRNSVEETYKLIISDLEFSVKNGTNKIVKYGKDISENIYITKTFSQALLAKVYFSKGGAKNYQKTVSLCESIINSGSVSLEPNYESIFVNSIKSKEMIFSPYVNEKSLKETGEYFFRTNEGGPTDYFRDLADEQVGDIGDGSESYKEGYDPRFAFTYSYGRSEGGEYAGTRFGKYPSGASSFYYLRLAEVYLMYAEALVRIDGDKQKAIDALNKVRRRAYVKMTNPNEYIKDYSNFNKEEFLEDVRIEKLLELHIENAEPWFDLVRYSVLGNLKVGEIKPSITDEKQLVFPIPSIVLKNNPAFGNQNPGYDKKKSDKKDKDNGGGL